MQTIKNYMEDCVDDLIVPVLKRMGCCTCESCIYDVKAIALNALPPKYVVTKKGHFYTKLSALQSQFEVDIIAAISKAAEFVSRSPRHENYVDEL